MNTKVTNNMKTNVRKSIIAGLILLMAMPMLVSCRTMKTATPVGDYKITEGSTMTYARGKQLYLFWGSWRLGRTSVATPPSGSCCVRTYQTFWDRVLTSLTAGIFSIQTIHVDVKRPVANSQATMEGAPPAAPASPNAIEM